MPVWRTLGLLASVSEGFDWGNDRRPRHEADAIIYELHVRGFTQHPSSGVVRAAGHVRRRRREDSVILRELGVTIVELMPVFQFDPQAAITGATCR